ncbi:MAG: hypothetical protein NC191_07050 [Muribaculaceae bacterium]|nr:hypothetical protein [Muribaculaceae bacterium]
MYSLAETEYIYDTWPNHYATDRRIYELQNGITFLVSLPCQDDYRYDEPHVIVDINGTKGPNKMGIDGFRFSYKEDGITPSKRAYLYGQCITDSNWARYKGGTCSYLIAKNGWKFPHDYPVKKF